MSFTMARCTQCKRLIPESEAQASLERLKAIAQEQGKSHSEMSSKHYPLCTNCLRQMASAPAV